MPSLKREVSLLVDDFLFVKRGLGLPFSSERPNARLVAPSLAEKGFQAMEGGSSLFDLGNLEREE